jgi:TonB-linked SusC/RagA family outer membrane protein
MAKEDANGSSGQVRKHQLEQIRGNSIENILQGQVAGVVVNESAEPGGGIGISIRGTNSILGGTQPLYVVDGIPINPTEDAQGNDGAGQSQSNLSFLNPNDIEKVEILKDAAATAIYGARGANGVVIITTKSAEYTTSKNAFNVVVDHTIAQVNNQLDVLDGPQFEEYMNQRFLNQLYLTITDPNRGGIVFDGTQELNAANFPEIGTLELPYPQTTGISTNWQDETYRVARSNAYNISYRGGTPESNISMSLGMLNNQGVIINSNFNRLTYNVNTMRRVGKRIKIYTKTNLARSWGNAASVGNGQIFQQRGVVSQALQFQPIFSLLEPGQDDDVYAELNEGNIVSNPYTLAELLTDEKKATNLLQSLSANIKLAPKLTATIKGAFNYQRNTRDMYYPSNTTRGRRNNGEASQAYFDRTKGYGELNLRYQTRIKKKHGIDAIVIGTYEQTNDRRLFSKAFGFGNDATSFHTFQSATDILVPVNIFNQFALLSGLSRVGYNLKRKYFVDVHARVDASSKFARNQRTAFFPSVSLGWIASKEKFLKKSKTINYLKFRASFGQTGSNPIAPFQSLSLLSPIRYNFNNSLVTGFYESNLSNADLSWETTDQYNAGFDLKVFNSRVRMVFDIYYKRTRDLLQFVKLPPSNGYGVITDNFGEVENKGFDYSFIADIVDNNTFSWTTRINFSLNRNKLLSLNSNLEFQLGPPVGFSQTNPILFMEGQPLGIFWGAETDGIYSSWEEANASGIQGAAPGEIRYVNHSVDVDEEGQVLPNQVINFDDYVQIGDPNPDFTVAISNNFKLGKFDLSVLVTGQKGGDILWVDSWQLTGMQRATNVLSDAYSTAWRAPISYVQGEESEIFYDPANDGTVGASHPAPLRDPGARALVSDRQIFDGSFIRLKNFNLGYNHQFKQGNGMRFYVSGRNLLTVTSYPGYDPETQAYNKDPQRRGVDFGTYPQVRSLIFGLRLNF